MSPRRLRLRQASPARVNLSSGAIAKVPLDGRLARAYIGGHGLAEKRSEEAASVLHAAVESDWHGDVNGRVIASSNLTAALVALRRLDEAHKAARDEVIRAPESPDAHFNLGRTLEVLGRRAEAVQEYRDILLQHPDHDRAREALRRLGVTVPEASDIKQPARR